MHIYASCFFAFSKHFYETVFSLIQKQDVPWHIRAPREVTQKTEASRTRVRAFVKPLLLICYFPYPGTIILFWFFFRNLSHLCVYKRSSCYKIITRQLFF